MNTNPFYIAKLLVRKFNGTIRDDEQRHLDAWLQRDSTHDAFVEELKMSSQDSEQRRIMHDVDLDHAWENIEKKRRTIGRFNIWKVASIILVFISLGLLYYNYSDKDLDSRIVTIESNKHKNDILPAQSGAHILTASGEEFAVDENVKISDDGSFSNESNELVYSNKTTTGTEWNKLVVPAANFFKMTLSDGTMVWVNAHSELSFPTTFVGSDRRVKLSGEAYFEVKHDAGKPFYVESEGSVVKVLGTHFNVSARTNKPLTTLVEGKVEVSAGKESVVLVPGQQSRVESDHISVKRADFHKDLAWKNNVFYFKGDNIIEIAQQLESWYDVDIAFSRHVSLTNTYSGEIRRNANLSEVLTMLEFVSGLDFKIDGKKLLILNKNDMT